MCGLTGFVSLSKSFSSDEEHDIITRMTSVLHHRGPDDEGFWSNLEDGIALGFRRLAIVDPTLDGHQPMISRSGRYIVVFNGEIYNYRDLKTELLSLPSSGFDTTIGRSDTAIMLAAFEEWGVAAAVQRFVGMFAFALWDREEGTLHLCRDRIGEKPLYFARFKNSIVFGSELKSIKQHPDFSSEMDLDALNIYMRRTFIPAPHTIYKSVSKLLPGTLLSIDVRSGVQTETFPLPVPYWSAGEAAQAGQRNPFSGSEADAIAHLDELLQTSVHREMVADVPIGAFLSGGIDSSLIVAIMQASTSRPVRTFSIGFEHGTLDEAPHAKAVASHLGTDHTDWYVTDQDARDVIPLIPNMYDEPFADSSQIPTYLVSKLARSQVTVSLSGDGGDEVFGGYNGYRQTSQMWKSIERVPVPFRAPLGALGSMVPESTWDHALLAGKRFAPHLARTSVTGRRLRTALGMLKSSGNPLELYESLITRTAPLSRDAYRPFTQLQHTRSIRNPSAWSPSETMMFYDLVGVLPDDIMTKVDRASMAVSLETRAPFLDHGVVEYAWQLPSDWKMRGSQGKWILRQVLDRYVPRHLVDRPKQGFAVPIGEWMRGPLHEWAEELIRPERIKSEGLLDANLVAKEWNSVMKAQGYAAPGMWSILMLQSWLDQQ